MSNKNQKQKMKKKQTLTRIVAVSAMVVAAISSSYAQTNLGSACGCPAVATRPSVLLSTLAVSGGASDGDLLNNTILTCDKTWILDKKIYVPNGKTLTIQPGTVIKGRLAPLVSGVPDPAQATALIVSRGGKMIADGTADCQIVMTAEADPLDGSFPINTPTASKWGGLCIAGQASNTLTLAKNGPFNATGNGKICVADGLGTFEGFATSDVRNQFGVNMTTPQAGYNAAFDDNDNSGVYKYLSVRYAGAILTLGGELNGISLGAVGRGTIIDHIEVIAAADDNMEFWGGTVNVKNATFMFGNDDMFDWDCGYSGKVQNVFSIKSSTVDTATAATKDADNGFEMDSDDQQSGNGSGVAIGTIVAGGYRSHPIIYNVTMIGNKKSVETSDNTGMAAIQAKELTEGEIYNSVFANFAVGLNLWSGNQSGEGTRTTTTSSTGQTVLDTYDNWKNSNGTPSLIVKNNTFVGMNSSNTAPIAKDVTKSSGVGSYNTNPSLHTVTPADTLQFYVTDGNTSVATIPGFNYNWTFNPANNTTATGYDATPDPSLATTTVAPADGFFTPENFRGAFESGKPSFLSNWAYASLLQTTGGLAPCPTDVNQDGKTDNADFLLLLGNFNQNCH
jgi:hypothetical protein